MPGEAGEAEATRMLQLWLCAKARAEADMTAPIAHIHRAVTFIASDVISSIRKRSR